MAAHAGVPVVNALSDDFHPCQILADWLTVLEHKGELAGLTVAYLGDGANNMGPLVRPRRRHRRHARARRCPGGLPARPRDRGGRRARRRHDRRLGRRHRRPAEALRGADVVITDTWVSMGQETRRPSGWRCSGATRSRPRRWPGGAGRDRPALPAGVTAAWRSPRTSSTARRAWCGTRRRTGCTRRRPSWPGCWRRRPDRGRPPTTKAARQQLIVELLGRHAVRSQGDLVGLLEAQGVVATPSTVSRDLVELDAVRVRRDGGLVYAVPAEGGDATPARRPSTAPRRRPGSPGSAARCSSHRRGVGQPRRPAHPAGGGPVPGLGHRPCDPRGRPGHHRR